MGFRINKGIFQFKDTASDTFINKFKIDDRGDMVEVDPDGNAVTAYMKIGDKATDAELLDGIDSSAFIRSNADDTVSAHTEWQDSKEIRLGNGADFRMWHDGSHTYFRNYNHGNGNIYFQGEDTAGANHALLYMFTANTRPYVSLYEDGGERFKTTSAGVEVLGDAYINQGRIHIKRGTGLTHTEWEDDSSANGRAQLILDSHYSDLIIASRNANSNKHGSTLTFATQSTSTNDVAKWVIGQGQYQEGANIMAFAYSTNQTNPHSILGTDNANAEMLITNGAGVWSRNGFSGNLSGRADTAITARDLGDNYTADTWFRATGDNKTVKFYGNSRMMVFRTDGEGGDTGHTGYAFKWTYGGDGTGATRMLLDNNGNLWTSSYGWLHSRFETAGAAGTVETNVNARINDEVIPAVSENADSIASNRAEITALGSSKLDKTAKAADSNLLDGKDSGLFFRRESAANGTAGAGWITVATCTSGRHSGEVYVTDGESGDHAFIRIHWMRSYQDSNFTVLNCGGHANRITGARVLYQTSDTTYGVKLLQVYVTVSSNYYVRIHQEGDTPNFGTPSAVTPVVENTKSGYALHGTELTNLDAVSLAAEEGIRVGGTAYINGINSTGGDIQNNKGSYLHIGGWGVSRTHASAVLVNTAYRADYATNLWDENISRFTNDSGYITQGSVDALGEELRPQISTAQTTADNAATAAANAQGTADTALARADGAREDTVAIGELATAAQAAADAAQATADGKLGATEKAADSEKVDGINGASLLRSDANDTFTGTLTMGKQHALVANNYGRGVYGVYSATRYQHVWSMGTAYNLADNGTGTGNLYGISWTHSNVGGESISGLGHQMLIMSNGDTRSAIGDGIWTKYNIYASGGNSTNWNAAYSWGNHAGLYDSAGSAAAVESVINNDVMPPIATNADNIARNATDIAGKAAAGGSYSQDFAADDMRVDQWFRNTVSGKGLYNEATTQHFYSDDDDYWNVAGGTGANGIRFRDEHAGTIRGYVYANSSNEVGFLDAGGSWAIKHLNDNGTYFYTDNSTEEFKVGRDAVTGNYGTVQVSSNRGGWGGYSIYGQYVLMSNGSRIGIYNDIDNEWMLQCHRNAQTELYHNGSRKLYTNAGGINVDGVCTATSFSGSGAGLTNLPIPDQSIPVSINGQAGNILVSMNMNLDMGQIEFTLTNGQTFTAQMGR